MTDDVRTLLFVAEEGDVPELDLHGSSTHNLDYAVDEFLSSASYRGEKAVRIIHGKGEGVLSSRLRDVLRKHPLVLEQLPIRGGGATAVVLK